MPIFKFRCHPQFQHMTGRGTFLNFVPSTLLYTVLKDGLVTIAKHPSRLPVLRVFSGKFLNSCIVLNHLNPLGITALDCINFSKLHPQRLMIKLHKIYLTLAPRYS